MSQLNQTTAEVTTLMALVQSAELDLASSREELERLLVEAQEALGAGLASDAIVGAGPETSAQLVEFWVGVSAQLDTEVERLAIHQRDVLALVEAALERTREENDAGEVHDAPTGPNVWASSWQPPVLAAAPIEQEPDPESLAPSGRQRLARLLLLLGSTLMVVALLLLVV